MEPRLQNELRDLGRLAARGRLLRQLAYCWAGASCLMLILIILESISGWNSPLSWTLPTGAGIAAACVLIWSHNKSSADPSVVIPGLEKDHPELRHLLSAASEQAPDPNSGRYGFLQMRVIEEVLTHPRRVLWSAELKRSLSSARKVHVLALLSFLVLGTFIANLSRGRPPLLFAPWISPEITVTPGDTQVERGTGLVISARFGRNPPAEATLVMVAKDGQIKQLPMARRLADPVFGASIPEITEDGRYHIEYGTKSTRHYSITVFDYPALVRADAELRFPEYTGLTNQTIRDTFRVSAVEGSHLTYLMHLNKPVAQARLSSKDETLNLVLQTNALAVLPDFVLAHNDRYSLELIDAEGRKNKFPNEFIFRALTNRRPELKLVAPKGDQRVSPIEELQLQAEASDDFGLVKYGIGFGVGAKEPKIIELGQASGPNEKRKLSYLIALEDLGVEPDQLISYFVWADDLGPDGKPRRTYGDMFFAEVRPFEEIFRQDQSGVAQNRNQSGNQGQGQGNQGARLAELQKQIVVATWNLQRETPKDHEK